MTRPRTTFLLAALALLACLGLVATSCSSDSGDSSSDTTSADATSTDAGDAEATTTTVATSGELVGTFGIDPGAFAGGAASGSYFRMVQSDGTVADGPYLPNGDSTAGDQTYTLLEPGSDGGLISGDFQPDPDPAYDAAGNALADAIITPTPFFGVGFSLSTNEEDPQTGEAVEAVSITNEDGTLTGETSAVSASYSNQAFNQGAPKPDGSSPGQTTEVSGTYDDATGAYVLEWASQIVGGPFDGFTGVWHLEGTFTAG
jgi:hypothetical protein